MTDTTNRFDHDRSPYERPNHPFRCGREAAFGKPCPRGPTMGGQCQGMADCAPFQTRKIVTDSETGEEREILRWECRRPAWAGGPCAEGPRPDGACACSHPPCAPRPTLRRQRGRWALLAVAAVVSLAIALMGFGGMNGLPSSVDPGELSGQHAQFTAEEGCVSCHAGHSETLTGWASAIFEGKTISESCVSCHAFGEDRFAGTPQLDFISHNYVFPNNPNDQTADCQGCHTEHRGEHASIITLTDRQCAACHTETPTHFADKHPPFGGNFPHENPRTVKFSHSNHFDKHFADARYADRAPEAGCVTCHTDQVDGRLLPGSFEIGCASCHEQGIKEQGFPVYGLPELADPTLTADAAVACGFSAAEIDPARSLIAALAEALPAMESLTEAVEAADPDAIAAAAEAVAEAKEALADSQVELDEAIDREEAVSLETLPLAKAYLLGHDAEDLDSYSEDVSALLVRAVEEGRAPLDEAVESKGGDPAVLLAGLSHEMVTRVTCAWAANQEYEPMSDPESGSGWNASEYQVSYLPTGHADPVVQNWIGLALAARGQDSEGAEAFAERMLDPSDGPGRCFKCHVAPGADAEAAAISWRIPRQDTRPFTAFDHTPHLNVLNVGSGCATCHRDVAAGETLGDAQKRPGPHPNDFRPIEQGICAECHQKGAVRQDCTLCHRYHSNPSIRKRTM